MYKELGFSGKTKYGVEYRFPGTGKECFFRDSILPNKPWPQGCKVYQADDFCSTYEISNEGNYIMSCDIAMVAGQCLAPNTKPKTCIEYCPPEGCVKEKAMMIAASVIALIATLTSSMA